MVKYQEFVSLVFEIARERGRTIDSLEDSQEFLGIAADLWSDNKETLKELTTPATKEWLKENA